jgi:hypothetical protein
LLAAGVCHLPAHLVGVVTDGADLVFLDGNLKGINFVL